MTAATRRLTLCVGIVAQIGFTLATMYTHNETLQVGAVLAGLGALWLAM